MKIVRSCSSTSKNLWTEEENAARKFASASESKKEPQLLRK
uniref:Uncharacterized protein n=1 Tax=Brassica oleracea TaxID=3712 RepID=A0A3P6ET07_BRAOL|nr:unnamed protein product [Brassica oleracea]